MPVPEYTKYTNRRLLDCRSAGEYQGIVVRAQRGGHIPGAVNIDWTEAMTPNRLLKPRTVLTEMYATKGITPDHEIVTYCHSHPQPFCAFLFCAEMAWLFAALEDFIFCNQLFYINSNWSNMAQLVRTNPSKW